MADASTLQPPSTQRLKGALIPALTLVLVSIVWPSEEETASAVAPESADPSATDSRETIPQQNEGVPTSALIQGPAKPWPVITLDDILQHDPFAVPPALLRLAAAPATATGNTQGPITTHREGIERDDCPSQLQERIETLKKRQVSVLLRSPKGAMAVIDSKVVREGDLLEDGLRVVEIGLNGVVLEIEAPQLHARNP